MSKPKEDYRQHRQVWLHCNVHQPIASKIGVTYGNPETTTGGNALKFYYASVRLDIRQD